jgi:tripartite-type tricarboxylate transporter receptor subunit TctC
MSAPRSCPRCRPREIGLPDYWAYSWYGVFGPVGLRREIVTRTAAAVEQARSDAAIQAGFEQMGTPAMRGSTSERFAEFVRTENATWAPLVRSLGITGSRRHRGVLTRRP